jgi:membrane protease YdiL (CAAX protease family)
MDTAKSFLDRRFIVTGLLVLFSVFFLGFFSQSEKVNPVFQTLLVSVTFLLVVPILYSKIVLQESLKNLGWQEGRMFLGILSSIVSVAIALGIIFLLMRTTSFSEHYVFPVGVEMHFGWFVFYELVLVTVAAFLYEFFFRGLVQLLWLRSFGVWAAVLQSLFFFGLLFLGDDVSWQRVPMILFSPFAGAIAYLSRSIWYSFGASWVFFFLTDVFLLVIR